MSPRAEGTPQGGPLSPLLSNILLDEWDKEREQAIPIAWLRRRGLMSFLDEYQRLVRAS